MPARSARSVKWLCIIVAGAILAVYSNSFAGAFVFDDSINILKNEDVRRLWPVQGWLGSRRPVATLTLALNYHFGRYDPWGYHLVNLAVHLCAALTLFGVLHRSMRLPRFGGRFQRLAPWFAFSVALLWAVHPLQTQSVTYIVQRGESLMGLLYLLTLYCLIRGAASHHARRWYAASIACCALGMGCKAVMITAPIVMLIYDRLFLVDTFIELLKRRWALYAGLAATWIVLALCGVARGVLNPPAQSVATVGFGVEEVTPLQYLLTQPAVILHYLELSFWPHAQCLDYGWPAVGGFAEATLPGLLILCLVGVTIWALIRRHWLGFAGAWFFVILAPTSSFIPIKDLAYEHRMYLSLAGLLTVAVAALIGVISYCAKRSVLGPTSRRIAFLGLLLAPATALGVKTYQRNALFADPVRLWQDTITTVPHNPRGHNALAWVYLDQERNADAIRKFRDAIDCDPSFAPPYANLGAVLLQEGDADGALTNLRRALRLDPSRFGTEVHRKMAAAFLLKRDYAAAIRIYREAIRMDPRSCRENVHLNLGHALMMVNRLAEAIEAFRTALRLNPNYDLAYFNLGNALGQTGDWRAAKDAYQNALRVNPRSAEAHVRLGVAFANSNETHKAVDSFRSAMENLTAASGAWVPIEAHYQLGRALQRLGRHREAAESFRAVLAINPSHPGAKQGLKASAPSR